MCVYVHIMLSSFAWYEFYKIILYCLILCNLLFPLYVIILRFIHVIFYKRSSLILLSFILIFHWVIKLHIDR